MAWLLEKIIIGGAAAIGSLLAAINRSKKGTDAR